MMFARKKRQITHLLLVEDEPLIAFDNEHFLTDEGFEIVGTVDRVADALALLGGGVPVDLVLVDVQLADGSGVDVARAARERGVPSLFVTGNCPADAADLAVGCLVKPYPARDLVAAIAAVDAMLSGNTPKRLPPGLSLFERA